mmetsp:Transcript_39927/g.44607  ORF Transcript_39927/g.44607 Transcript_39927/m.44607 type:complete len:141 (+) Transcript_39927:1-423(+)
MMFYQDEDDDDDDDDEDIMMMNMAPSSASRLSFYNQEQKEEVTPDVNKNTPSSASNTTLSLLTGIALSLASPVSDDTKDDDDDDDDEYGIFLSFSEDENDEHYQYNDGPSSPSLKYNDYAFHKTTTATTGGRGRRQQWME